MAATFRILTHMVGERGQRSGAQVLRIQQLLFLNGFRNVRPSGVWDIQTGRALISFWEKYDSPTQKLFMCDQPLPSCDNPRAYLKPDDSILFGLAYGAGVLIRLAPGGNIYRGSLALEDVHRWCEERVSFTQADHAVWGLQDYPFWAIVTQNDPPVFDVGGPPNLNCTLYANLMMSVWHQGNAHERPFDANVKTVGTDSGLLSKRYYYGDPVRYENINDITKFTAKYPDRLYCLESGREKVGHEALLHKGKIYQCNLFVDCQSVPLKVWLDDWASHSHGWISGPSPQ